MILFGSSGAKWKIEDKYFAKGGEGELHHVIGTEGYVVKLYKEGVLTPIKQEKLSYMTTLYSKERLKQLAWPVDMVKDQSGRVIGFVMKRFGATEDMANLLDGSSNKAMNLDWKKRIVIAQNLSLLVAEIHSMGQIIGDMNPKNFGVDMNNGFVCAFDTDSFHLYDAGARKWYPCTVLDPHYIAPELQERFHKGAHVDSFRPEETFSAETDRFALAILIFQLLFNGTHPFTAARVAGRGSSVIVYNRVTNIYQRMSPYFNPSPNMTLPLYAPPLDIVPGNMQSAFRKAFLENRRPQAYEWVEMLDALRGQLTRCENGHYYGKHNAGCPWCIKEAASARPVTPPTPTPNNGYNHEQPKVRNYVQAQNNVQVQNYAQVQNNGQVQNPTQGQQGNSTGKTRSWYAHEIVNLFFWLVFVVIPPENPNKLILCLITHAASCIARLAKRKNETLPTGFGAKLMAWANAFVGICLLICYALSVTNLIGPYEDKERFAIFCILMGCMATGYGVASIKDSKK